MNDIVTTNASVPAHLAARVGVQSSVLDDMHAGIGSGFKRISIRGGKWRIREAGSETVLPHSTMRCIIVGAGPSVGVAKSYYKGAYNPKAEERGPDCYSNDGIRPAADAEDPQSQLCTNCEHNQWGSKISDNGNKMKACADQKKLAVIDANDKRDDPEVYLFTVTPAALSEFRNYARLLESKGFPAELVITEMSFDPDEAYPKTLFSFGGFVSEDMVSVVDRLVDSPLVNELVGKTPAVAKIVEKKPAKASPVKEVQVEEVTPEVITPTKKNSFGGTPVQSVPVPQAKEPTAVTSSSLAADIQSILEGMQDDDD